MSGEGTDGPRSGVVADGLVVPALELAVVVARVSSQLRPPLPVPRGLRSLLRFTKLPGSARPAVRRVLEEDEEFRGRVAAAADQIDIPRASYLYLHRPVGWEEELATLAEAAEGAGAEAEAERGERALRRRLAGAEERLVRLDEALFAARAEAARAGEELAAERKARREAEDRATGIGRKLASVEAERDSARRRADEASERAEGLARRVADAEAGERDAGGALARELDAAHRSLEAAEARVAASEARAAASEAAATMVTDAIADAGSAALALGEALARAADAMGRGVEAPSDMQVGGGPPRAGSRPTPSRAQRLARGRTLPAREPHRLPPAMFDDSPEAAAHLVRVAGMLVLVDGYNVTLSTWHDLPIAEQRARLIDACAELAARVSSELLIVFDGAEEPGDLPPAASRPRVRWRFSPAGVEADDMLLELVADLDPARPVTVASSDRRVRDGARRLGANAISTPQLLSALRREQA